MPRTDYATPTPPETTADLFDDGWGCAVACAIALLDEIATGLRELEAFADASGRPGRAALARSMAVAVTAVGLGLLSPGHSAHDCGPQS